MDLRLPHHLVPGTLIVFEGPPGSGKTTQIDMLWQAAHGLGLSRKPLFDRMPVFTQRPAWREWGSAHARDVVLPALRNGRSVFMDQCWWSDAIGSDARLDRARAEEARRQVHPDFEPDVIFVLNPGGDAEIGGRYLDLAKLYPDTAVVLTGHQGEVCEEMFATLHRRGLYFGKPSERDHA